MQFWKINGIDMNINQAREYAEQRALKIKKFCPYCISGGIRHTKICPTLKEGFNPLTAHILTREERAKLKEDKLNNKK